MIFAVSCGNDPKQSQGDIGKLSADVIHSRRTDSLRNRYETMLKTNPALEQAEDVLKAEGFSIKKQDQQETMEKDFFYGRAFVRINITTLPFRNNYYFTVEASEYK